jgi:hypothetical protein
MQYNRFIQRLLPLIACTLFGCASGYKEFYKPANGVNLERVASQRAGLPPIEPLVERARRGNDDEVLAAYAKRGYVMIGHSMFNTGRPETEQAAVAQGKEVGADIVLILDPKYTGSVTTSIPITTPTTSTTYSTGTATAYGSGSPVTAYGSGTSTTYGTSTSYVPITVNRSDYGAVYFVKQKFNLGAFFRDLTDAERQELQTNRGAVIRLVVDNTPAFNSDLLVGDILISVDGIIIGNSQALSDLLRQRTGKQITLLVSRHGKSLEKVIQLQP